MEAKTIPQGMRQPADGHFRFGIFAPYSTHECRAFRVYGFTGKGPTHQPVRAISVLAHWLRHFGTETSYFMETPS